MVISMPGSNKQTAWSPAVCTNLKTSCNMVLIPGVGGVSRSTSLCKLYRCVSPSRGMVFEPYWSENLKWILQTRGPFLESPDNFSGPESYFMCVMFAMKTQILLFLKAEQ